MVQPAFGIRQIRARNNWTGMRREPSRGGGREGFRSLLLSPPLFLSFRACVSAIIGPNFRLKSVEHDVVVAVVALTAELRLEEPLH